MNKCYYFIDSSTKYPQTGSGEIVPDGFIEYIIGQEPQDLLDALAMLKTEETAAQQIQLAKDQRAAAMLEGDVYTLDGVDYRVSFTSDDGNGMLQVKAAFDVGLASTIIHFANGTNMPITSSEYLAFAQWFATKRNEFFV